MAIETGSETDSDQEIICRVTRWYYRRMGLVGLMLVVFGLYFLYDWKVGYPAANEIAAKQTWFENELLASWDEAEKAGTLVEWMAKAEENGWPKGLDGEPPKWVSYAAQNGWPEKPKRFTEKEVQEQFYWGMGTLSLAGVVGVLVLLSRNQTLIGRTDELVTPAGKVVKFADVYRVDTRKWDNKGLAYAYYKEDGGGREQKATLDDLKFGGADGVLKRLLAAFKGELIEKVVEPEDEAEGLADSGESAEK